MFFGFLFPRYADQKQFSMVLLGMRLLFGGLLLVHGIGKLTAYASLSEIFPDPIGIGSRWALNLAIFGEVFCSAAFIIGFLYRLSMIPMLVTMLMAFFVIHHGRVAEGELAFVYLMVFVLLYIAGPGKYSVDYLISGYLRR